MTKDFLGICSVVFLTAVVTSCAKVDIQDEGAVLKGIQGTWTGYEPIGNLYRHIKLNISDNTFQGWLQTSDSVNEPSWTVLPTETGTISLSSVLEKQENSGKYRKISFHISGRCCGDNSLTAKTLSQLVSFDDVNGLIVADQLVMTRK